LKLFSTAHLVCHFFSTAAGTYLSSTYILLILTSTLRLHTFNLTFYPCSGGLLHRAELFASLVEKIIWKP
jgi:hypothetical protein